MKVGVSFSEKGLELCYFEMEAHQWKDQDHPDSACDGSDLIAVVLTIVFDGGRTERVRLSTCGGTNSWLPNEVAGAAHFFLSVEQDDYDEMWGPLPPETPTKEEHNERHKQGLLRWQEHCTADLRWIDPPPQRLVFGPNHPFVVSFRC